MELARKVMVMKKARKKNEMKEEKKRAMVFFDGSRLKESGRPAVVLVVRKVGKDGLKND